MPRAAVLLSVLAAATCFRALSQAPGNLLHARYQAEEQLKVGNLLVASEKLGDPNFAETVVLIVEHDEDGGTLGLIINRRSEVPLSKVFPDIKNASADPVYVGGPVSLTVVQALLRVSGQAEDLTHVAGDVYATGSKQVIEKSVRTRVAPAKFRLYVGYAGWAPGQLEAEVRLGAWSVLANRSNAIFDEDPDSLWSRLSRESHMQIAALHHDAALFIPVN
jgi:putative transcriptional regulator